VDTARDTRRRLGQRLVEAGIHTADQLTHALAEQDRSLRPLGEILVQLASMQVEPVSPFREHRAAPRPEAQKEPVPLRVAVSVVPEIVEEQLHVLSIPVPGGYALLERAGSLPALAGRVELEGDSQDAGLFVVRKHGRLVRGGPRCAFLERLA
jgi:hypothetical protein